MSKVIPDLNFQADPHLVAQGWERRFMVDMERASEAIELYASLGFEVRTESVLASELSDQCMDCQLLVCNSYVTIYTRRSTGE